MYLNTEKYGYFLNVHLLRQENIRISYICGDADSMSLCAVREFFATDREIAQRRSRSCVEGH